MDSKKPIILNDLEEWDFTDDIDSLIQKEEAVDLEFKTAKDGLPNSLWDTYSSFANTDGGVVVLGNPGTMLVSKAQYCLGGDSVCRNKALQKMFMLIGFSEKAGSRVNKITKGWREANWQKPYVEESNRPDKVELTLPKQPIKSNNK